MPFRQCSLSALSKRFYHFSNNIMDEQELQLQMWRHRKTGGFYCVLCEATRESDLMPLIIYRNTQSGQKWAMAKSKFLVRFESVNTMPQIFGALPDFPEPKAGED